GSSPPGASSTTFASARSSRRSPRPFGRCSALPSTARVGAHQQNGNEHHAVCELACEREDIRRSRSCRGLRNDPCKRAADTIPLEGGSKNSYEAARSTSG